MVIAAFGSKPAAEAAVPVAKKQKRKEPPSGDAWTSLYDACCVAVPMPKKQKKRIEGGALRRLLARPTKQT